MLEKQLALSQSSVFTPECSLPTQWFIDRQVFSERFIEATGIINRRISSLDELGMARKALESLKEASHFDPHKCAGIVVASSSLSAKDQGLYEYCEDQTQGALFQTWPAVSELAEALRQEINPRIKDDCSIGINWGCNGFVRGVEILRLMHEQEPLRDGQFYLLVTANRLSSRVNFGSPTSGLFGDAATATIVTGFKDPDHVPHFVVHYAHAQARQTEGIGFYMEDVPAAISLGHEGQTEIASRVCIEMKKEVMGRYGIEFTQDGLLHALSDLKMPKGTPASLLLGRSENELSSGLTHPEQGATGSRDPLGSILMGHATSLVADKIAHNLRRAKNETPILRSTRDFGNTSSSAIVNEIVRHPDLTGLIACPVTGAGPPGEPYLGQGCLILEGLDKNKR